MQHDDFIVLFTILRIRACPGLDPGQTLKLAMKIVELRDQKGLSQQEPAKLMGTGQQANSTIESGEYGGFTLKTLEKIAEATVMRIKIEFVSA